MDESPPRPRLVPAAIRRVLFPTDLSPESDAAFGHARLIAERFQADLRLYHAIDLRRMARTAGPGAPMAEVLRRAELAASEHLHRRAGEALTRTQTVVDFGLSPYQALVAEIHMSRPDVTVMSTHGRRGLAHLVLGSVAETAIELGRRPILCVRGSRQAAALPYRRVLLPTDLISRQAFSLAALLARAFNAALVALHVVPFRAASLSGVPDALDSAVPDEAEVLAFLQHEFAGARVEARVELGTGWRVIPDVARKEECDLIVMSTHGDHSLADTALGSRAERVVGVAPCPVLVV